MEKVLSDKEKLFCEYYAWCNNGHRAARLAQYSRKTARIISQQLLKKDHIIKEVMRQKQELTKRIGINKDDIIRKYIEIAFSDIGNYISFGKDENKGNYLHFHDSDEVDTTLIDSVSKGRDGTSIKLCNKMNALSWLAEYFELNKDQTHKWKIDDEKLKIEKEKFEKGIVSDEKVVKIDLTGLKIDGD